MINFNILSEKFIYKKVEEYNFKELIGTAVTSKKIDFALYAINQFHKSNKKTSFSLNAQAFCLETRGKTKKAKKLFRESLDKLNNSGESNYIIVNNYLNNIKKYENNSLEEEEKLELIEKLNNMISNEFNNSDWAIAITTKSNTLFKYSTFNINTIDSITNQYFYLSEKNQLNDPIEFPDLNDLSENQFIKKDYRICSFTNNNNSMLMWSHYTQDHQGIMIEYWFGGEIPNGFGIDKITYADEPKRAIEKNKYIFNQYVLTKNKDWSYENEVRLFAYKKNKVYYEKFNEIDDEKNKINAQIQSITLGCKFPDHKKELVINIAKSLNLKRNKDNKKVTIREAYIPKDSLFSISYRTIYDPENDI